jgi:hypothetical protein
MDIAPELPNPAPDLNEIDPALALQLDEITAELRDRRIEPRPLTILRYAIELGLPEELAADLVALLNHRNELGNVL